MTHPYAPDRRRFLASAAVTALALGSPLAVARPVARRDRIRSCILIFYYGGPSHLDTFDPKPDAPAEVRGEYHTIATAVPGVRVCEYLPRAARLMNRLALVRALHH